MRHNSGRLWRHPDFLRFWTGETLSLFGSQVTVLALPLTAVLTLRATPVQMGVLDAALFAPFLVVTLFAGVWVDRVRRRPILIATNLCQAVVPASIPLFTSLRILQMGVLYAAGFLLGSLRVPFQLAYQAYLPALVDSEEVLEGNSKLQMSASAAQVAGPGLAGVIVQALGAPIALLVDAASFLISAVGVASIRRPEHKPESHPHERGLSRAIGEGMRLMLGDAYLRALAGDLATGITSGALETIPSRALWCG
jgi:MFS family permease